MQDLINGKHSCPAAAGLFYENPVGSRNYKLFCHATMIGNSARALVTGTALLIVTHPDENYEHVFCFLISCSLCNEELDEGGNSHQ